MIKIFCNFVGYIVGLKAVITTPPPKKDGAKNGISSTFRKYKEFKEFGF